MPESVDSPHYIIHVSHLLTQTFVSAGWPFVPRTPLVRSDDTNAWEHAPVQIDTTKPQVQSADCLARLVNLGLLNVCSRLLASKSIPNVLWLLLPVLLSCGRSGNELALAVCQCQPILDEFKSELEPHVWGKQTTSNWATQYHVLKTARVLMQSGRNILDIFEAQGDSLPSCLVY